MDDIYYIPATSTDALYKEKGSKFIAYLRPIFSLADFEEAMEEIKKLHPKARHFCFAFRLTPKEDLYRYNDDGEPSGTAGRPIYNQILSANLHNVLIVVVRYFGGTKLGASGLIKAYKTAAEVCCNAVEKRPRWETERSKIFFEYSKMGHLLDALKSFEIEIIEKHFEGNPYVIVGLRTSIAEQQINQLKASLLGRSIEDIEEDTQVEGVVFDL